MRRGRDQAGVSAQEGQGLAPAMKHIKGSQIGVLMSDGDKQIMARKKKKPTDLYVILIGVIVLGGLALAAFIHQPSDAEAGQGRISDRSRICMLQDTIQPRSGLEYVYHGKKYYLCCAGCLAAFQQNAAIHSHAMDPVNGESVDKADAPSYAYHGRAYFFSSVANMSKFAGDPERFAAGASSQAAEK
jgi:YHS domain-containing protein